MDAREIRPIIPEDTFRDVPAAVIVDAPEAGTNAPLDVVPVQQPLPGADHRPDTLAEAYPPGQVVDPTQLALPDMGDGYEVTSRAALRVAVQFKDKQPYTADLSGMEDLQKMFPATATLYTTDSANRRLELPTPEGWNKFGREVLEPLGATTMTVQQVPGGNQTAEFLADCYADGIISVATDSHYLFHDSTDHTFGAKTFPEQTTRVFRQIAGVYRSLRDTEPEGARILAVALARSFDLGSSMRLGFLDGKGEPYILSDVRMIVAGSMGWGTDEEIAIARRVLGAIETGIEPPPDMAVEPHPGNPTKLEQWGRWERTHVPAYIDRIKQRLSQQP